MERPQTTTLRSKLPGLTVATFLGLAALISTESLEKVGKICPGILDTCRTEKGDETRHPVRPEVQACIIRETEELGRETKALVGTCGQFDIFGN